MFSKLHIGDFLLTKFCEGLVKIPGTLGLVTVITLATIIGFPASESLREVSSQIPDNIPSNYLDILFAQNVQTEITVVVETSTEASSLLPDLRQAGLKISVWHDNLVQGSIHNEDLQNLRHFPFVKMVRPPLTPIASVVSEGVNTIGALALQESGLHGRGVRVAVLDLDFDPDNPEISRNVASYERSRVPLIDLSSANHGTIVSEIIIDVAPESLLYLYEVRSIVEFLRAIDLAIAEDVDIISASIGWLAAGPYDGTSQVSLALDEARSQGILPVIAAGNSAQEHWEGPFEDSDSDGWHDFDGDVEVNAIELGRGQSVSIVLNWDDWPLSDQDLDLYLFDEETENVVASSTLPQSFSPPVEVIDFVVPFSGTYQVAVFAEDVTDDVFFDIFVEGAALEDFVSEGSIGNLADSKGALTVGATFWRNDRLEGFSSRGPTSDGRIKPDLTGPDGVTTSLGDFFGTSASTPHVSGLAALLLEGDRSLSADDLQDLLEASALDLGNSGKDNSFGSGRANGAFALVESSPREVPLTVDGVTYPPEDQPIIFIWKADSEHDLSAPSNLSGVETQYDFDRWSDDSSSGERSFLYSGGFERIAAIYDTFHRLQVESSVPSIGANGSGWFREGSIVNIEAPPAVNTGAGTRLIFDGWSGDLASESSATTVAMDRPKLVVANWRTQYFLEVESRYGDPRGGGWYDSGSTAIFEVSNIHELGNNTRLRFSSWAGDVVSVNVSSSATMDGPKTIFPVWATQYFLTVSSPYGNVTGSGWYDDGDIVTISSQAIESQGIDSRKVFVEWAGDFSSSLSQDFVKLDSPKSIDAKWKTQHFVNLEENGGEVFGEGWYDQGVEAVIRASPISNQITDETRDVFTGWTGNVTSTSSVESFEVTRPYTISANWKAQNYLKVEAGLGRISEGSDWYDLGSVVIISAEQTVVAEVDSTRYVFESWGGSVQTKELVAEISMNEPALLVASWKIQYYLEVVSEYGNPRGEGWYDKGKEVLIEVDPEEGFLIRQVFRGWRGDVFSSSSTDSVLIDSPKKVNALWFRDYTQLVIVTLAVALSTLAALYRGMRR